MNPNEFDSILDSVLNEKENPSHERYKDPKRKKLVKSMTKDYDKRNPNSRDLRTDKSTAKRWPNGETAKKLKAKGIDVNEKTCSRPGCSKPAAELDHVDQSKRTYTSSGIPRMQNLCRDHHTQKTRQNVKKLGKDVNQHGPSKAEGIARIVDMVLGEGGFPIDLISSGDFDSEDRKKGRSKFKATIGRKKEIKDNRVELDLYHHPITPEIIISPKSSADREAFELASKLSAKRPEYYSVTVSSKTKEVTYKGTLSKDDIYEIETPYGASFAPILQRQEGGKQRQAGGKRSSGGKRLPQNNKVEADSFTISMFDIPTGKTVIFSAKDIKQENYELNTTGIIRIEGQQISPEQLKEIEEKTRKPKSLIDLENHLKSNPLYGATKEQLSRAKIEQETAVSRAEELGKTIPQNQLAYSNFIRIKDQFEKANKAYQDPIRHLEANFGFSRGVLSNFDINRFKDQSEGGSNRTKFAIELIDPRKEDYNELRKIEITRKLRKSGNSSKFKKDLEPKDDEDLIEYERRVSRIENGVSAIGGRNARNDTSKRKVALGSLLRRYNPVKKTRTGLQWISVGSVQNLEEITDQIYLLIPKNFGTVTSSPSGEMIETEMPSWLKDEDGISIIEPGEFRPEQSIYSSKGAERISDPNRIKGQRQKPIDWITDDELDARLDNYVSPHLLPGETEEDRKKKFNQSELLIRYGQMREPDQKSLKRKAISKLAIEVAMARLGPQKYSKLPEKEKENANLEARRIIGSNQERYQNRVKKIIADMMIDKELGRIISNTRAADNKCAECKGTGSIRQEVTGDVVKCKACGGTGILNVSGQVNKISQELMGTLVNDARTALSKLSSLTGRSDEDAVMNNWVEALLTALPKGFLGSQETDSDETIRRRVKAILNKILSSEQKLMKSFKTEPMDGEGLEHLYTTTTCSTNQISPKIIRTITKMPRHAQMMVKKQIINPIQSGGKVDWGFQAQSKLSSGYSVPFQVRDRSATVRELKETWDKTGGKYPIFIELRKFHNTDKHLAAMFTDMAKHSSKISKFVESRVHNYGSENILVEAFNEEPEEIDDALEGFEPQADKVVGVGLVINVIREETSTDYSSTYEIMLRKLAPMIGKGEFADMSTKNKKALGEFLVALQLAAKDSQSEINPENEKELSRMVNNWSQLDKNKKSGYATLAKDSKFAISGGERKTTEIRYGRHTSIAPQDSYIVKYLNLETGEAGVLHFTDAKQSVFLVKPIGEIKRKARTEAEIQSPPPPTSESTNIGDTILEMLSPKMVRRRGIGPAEIAHFID